MTKAKTLYQESVQGSRLLSKHKVGVYYLV